MHIRTGIFSLLAIAVLAALFLYFRPEPAPGGPAGMPTMEGKSLGSLTPASSQPREQVFDLRIENGRLSAGPSVLRVQEGERVVLRVQSNQADELHLHGYDRTLKLVPGQVAELNVLADRSGRFEYELHRVHRELGALEVLPR